MDNFVNLHNHSDYSLLDGFGTVDEYIARAVEMEQPALGLTDHGNVCGLFSFIQKCNKAGIKPIPGIEAYVAPVNPMGAKVHQPVRYGKPGQEGIDVSGNGAYLHMTLWAMNDEGLHSLYALVREASMEGNEFNHLDLPDGEGNYYMKPRMDLDMLARNNAGLIATTGCPSGEIQTRFRLGQDEQAYDYARRMSEIFEGRYFVELMDHSMAKGKDIERVAIPKLLKLADDLNLPLLATNDSHYCNHEDAPHHEEMLCANSKATMYDLPYDEGGKRFAFNGDEYYLKTRDEMLSIPVFHEHPEAVDNTMRIADMVERIEFKLRSDLRPEVEIPDGYDEIGWFKHEIKEGLKKKRSDASPEVKAEAVERINHELPVFTDNNFVQYMLVVKDYIDWARNNGIRVGYGRGSVGGSEIAFDLNISDTDPIRHNLMFERFLNPERLSPPDVDTDFAASRRDEVVDYVKDKYGEDHIANIITFNKFLSKTALADMARIYNIPVFESNKATKLIPEIKPNQGASLSDIYDEKSKIYAQAAEFRKLMEEEKWKPVIAAARAIEGRIKTTGVHACGIIMSSHPITDAAPMTYKHKPSKPWGSSCCQWTYEELESIGLIKMDFLSLSDLDIVGDTLANIMHTHDDKTVDIDALVHGPMDDKPTYDMLSRGETLNIFQLSSEGMQSLFKRMHPSKFEDIQASVALYRPGPMGMDAHIQYADRAAGKAPAYVINEKLDKVFKGSPVEEVLKSTENLVLYQEEIMNISRFLSDFSWGDADALRKGMGHKKMDVLNAMEPKFINNAVAKGYPREETTELWEYLKKFGEYGFNSCFDGRTLVCVSIGDDDYEKMRVEDIYREHESGAPLNISILSMYPDGSIKPHKVKSITKQPLKAVTYTIRTESGKYCNVTGNHRMLTTAGYGTIDDGTLRVGAELMIDDDWNRRIPLETLETRRKNALIASMDEHTRRVNSERMKEYQSTLSYEDRCAHQQAIQRLHPDRNDNSVKAMYDAHLNAHDNGALNGYGIMTRLSDGRVCDSRVEAQAGEYLLSRGVDFELHKPLTNKDGQVKYCDFYADGIYFEMDGLRRGRQYFVDNKYGDDIPFVYMTPGNYIDTIDAALMRHHVSNGDRIISIEPTKTLESGKPMRQTVYDIEMEHDGPANFIMQGIVSHNSHAASYAIISYETAYLKCHYPAEFMAAVLTDKIRKSKDVDDVKNAIREVREIGLKVGAIDIDNSDVGVSAVKKTSPDDPDIVFGISGIKGVSIGTAQEFVAARAKHDGKYMSVDDFMRSLPASLINKKFIDGLAGAGAFDKFGVSRRGMIACENELIDYYKSESKASAAGKESLFDFDDDDDDNNDGMGEFHIPEIQDWDWIQRLVEEEKRLGVAVSGHPLSNLGQGLEFMRKAYEISDDDYGNILTVDDAARMKLNQYRSGRYERRPSRVIASIASIEMKTMRTGRKAIRGTIESETDSIPFAIQGDPAEKWIARFGTASGLQQNHVYVIVGNITIDYNGNHVMEAVAFEEVELDSNGRIPVWIQLTKQDRKAYKDIRAIAKKHPGDIPLMIHMDKDGYKSEVDSGLKVDCSDEFMFELEQAIGRRKFGRYAE